MARTMTLRGVVSAAAIEQIMMFDSNTVSYGWKILDFRIATNNSSNLTDFQAGAALGSTSEQFTFEDWDESTMVGFATVSAVGNPNLILDYDHVIVSSLYLSNLNSDQPVNYMVVLEQIEVDPKQNIMYQLKERAQSNLV